MPKKKTTEETIADFRKVHGDLYDYSKVVYKNNSSKVKIICHQHGEFQQAPRHHVQGHGCQLCAYQKTATDKNIKAKTNLLEDFHKVHGKLYDYSKVNYVNSRQKVEIICTKHGSFFQTPPNHKKGKGCPRCIGRHKTKEQIISEFRKHHGQKYDYSKVKFKTLKEKIIIICPDHGEFLQKLENHKRGDGCPKCAGIIVDQNKAIWDFKSIHGERYDYSKFVYKNVRTKGVIICKEHGEFLASRNNHLKGHGCPKCGKKQVSEPLFRESLETIVSRFGKFEFPNVRPDWLKNPETGSRLELDCYNEKLKLAFELQGIQHYEPIEFWGGEAKFAKTIRRDNHKLTECRKHGVQLFRIDNRPVRKKSPQEKREYYENEIRKCLTKLPEKVKLKLVNANNKE